MIAKEWRDARWKFLIAAALFLALVTTNLFSYEQIVGNAVGELEWEPVDLQGVSDREISFTAVDLMFGTYEAGGLLLALLAVAVGATLVSEEAGRRTIYLLLSKPVSRTRMLLIKYTVGAVLLFALAVLGHVALVISAAARGYPFDALSVAGTMLSTVLLWLGALSVLSVALLCSVLFRNVLASLAAAGVALYFMYYLPQLFVDLFWGSGYNVLAPYDIMWQLTLPEHWANGALYTGRYFPGDSFLICLIAAVVPLLAALWLFNRRAY